MLNVRAARPLLVVFALFAALVVVAGCGSSDSSSTTSDSSSTTGASSGSEDSVVVAMNQFIAAIPFYQDAKLGAEDAVADDGNASLDLAAAPEPVVDQALATADALLNKGPDAFAVNPCGGPSWAPVMKNVAERVEATATFGCFPIGSPEDAESASIPVYVGVSDYELATDLVDLTVEQAKLTPDTEGTALLGNCSPGTPNLDARIEGYEDQLAKVLPKVKPVEFNSREDTNANLAAWSDKLIQESDTVIAFGACEPDGINLGTLKRTDGGDYALGVVTPNADQFPTIESGVVNAGVTSSGYLQGYTVTQLLVEALRAGEPMPEGWIDTGLYPITKENVGEWIDAYSTPEKKHAFNKKIADEIIGELSANTKPLASYFDR